MEYYFIIKTLHILSATILFGTGTGIAFFMLRSYFTDNLYEKFFAARTTVFADYAFTLPAVILQPLTGIWLVQMGGYDSGDFWLTATYGLYALTVACWLPVIWIQIRLKSMLATATTQNTPLPASYNRLFKIWFFLGWPAFASLIVIFLLMVIKPV